MNNRIAGNPNARRGVWGLVGAVAILAIVCLLTSATAADSAARPLWMEPYPLMDTVASTDGSHPIDAVSLGDRVLFVVHGPYSPDGNTIDLWGSDGTTAGTYRLQRRIDWEPEGLVALGDAALFAAEDEAAGRELWVSHGQPGDAQVLADIAPGAASSNPSLLTRAGEYVYFRADDDLPANALWRSDGTAAGTVKVMAFEGEDGHPDGFSVAGLVAAGPYLFMVVNTAENFTLWRSDGTAAGTILLHSVARDHQFGIPPLLMAHGDVAYFLYNQDFQRSDGTPAGTEALDNPPPHVYEMLWSAGDNTLYMMAPVTNSSRQIWRVDGSAAGAQLVATVSGNIQGLGKGIATLGDVLLFSNSTQEFGDPYGAELWISDGTAAGTKLLKDINPGPDPGSIDHFVVAGGVVYFSARGEYELWRSDGTANGTVEVPLGADDPAYPRIEPLEDFNGKLYFFAGHDTYDREPWISDGTAEGSFMLKDLNSNNTDPSNPSNPAYYRGNFYFRAYPGLWMSDGADRDPTLLLDLRGTTADIPQFEPKFVGSNGYLFFTVVDSNAVTLWRTDNTAAGTIPLQVVGEAFITDPVREMTDVNDTLYFVATGSNDTTLWRSDGTPEGTTPFIELGGQIGSVANELTAVGDRLFFAVADDAAAGTELWVSDGTAANTHMVKDINPGHLNANPAYLVENDGIVYFAADDGTHGGELWRSDGTRDGTRMVKDIHPGRGQSLGPSDLVVMRGVVYFLADDGTHGMELWRSDGTAAGTTMVKDAIPGADHVRAIHLVAGRNVLFFVAGPDINRYQPWISDGTAAGTKMIAAVGDDNSDDIFGQMTAVGDTLYFTLREELYESDGTAAGTFRLNQLYPHHDWYGPHHLLGAPGRLFFSADSRTYGREPFVALTSLVDLSPDFLYLPEGGVAKQFTVALNRPPSAAVTIALSGSEPLTINPANLTFTPANWRTPQPVSVAAPGDAVEQGTRPANIHLAITSPDAWFNDDGHALPVLVREWRFAYAPVVGR